MISCKDYLEFLATVDKANVVIIDPPYNLTHAKWDKQIIDWPKLSFVQVIMVTFLSNEIAPNRRFKGQIGLLVRFRAFKGQLGAN